MSKLAASIVQAAALMGGADFAAAQKPLGHWIREGLLVLLILAIVALVVVVLAVRAFRSSYASAPSDLSLSEEAVEDIEAAMGKKTVFTQTGRLPMSRTFKGSLFRWHDPRFCEGATKFWQTFQDGPWKWEAQQRYAGKDLNCGHFFALSAAGATAEAEFYKMALLDCRLLRVEVELDAVLDLTYEDNLLTIAKDFIQDAALLDRDFFMDILSLLLDDSKGGNDFTDYVGRWAHQNDYEGVLFFGARALAQFEDLKWQIEHGRDERMGIPVAPGHFLKMRREPSLMNLVVFSGTRLTTRARSYQLPPVGEVANPYFGWSESELDKLLVYNSDFQQERDNVIWTHPGKPFRVGKRFAGSSAASDESL
jgi:hypothetical protein